MSGHEALDAVAEFWWPGQHRFVLQVAAQIVDEFVGRPIPAVPILLEASHHNAVEVASQDGLQVWSHGSPQQGDLGPVTLVHRGDAR